LFFTGLFSFSDSDSDVIFMKFWTCVQNKISDKLLISDLYRLLDTVKFDQMESFCKILFRLTRMIGACDYESYERYYTNK